MVIPARLASTRLPGKLLMDLNGMPLLERVWRNVREIKGVSKLWIATDSREIETQAKTWGARVLRTPACCQSGTERILSILDRLPDGLVFNVQGDEPFLPPSLLEQLLLFHRSGKWEVSTAAYVSNSKATLANSHCVKVVRTQSKQALYFSRSELPHPFRHARPPSLIHLGIYLYSKAALRAYASWETGPLEKAEGLEQLRFLEHDMPIGVLETTHEAIGIDTPQDLEKARAYLAEKTP